METIVFAIDIIAFTAIIYFSIKNEKTPDKTEVGPFRISIPRDRKKKTLISNGYVKR